MFLRLKSRKFPTDALMVGILASFFFILAYLFVGEIIIHFDEVDILAPILNPENSRKYGDFPYFFYSWAITFGSFIVQNGKEIEFARVANCILYSFNLILFYHLLKNYFSKWWSILGTFLFATSPGVFFSAVEIKTESLLLFEFLILAISLENFLNSTRRNWFFYAGLSGFISSLGVSTKFFPLFPVLFFSSLYFLHKDSKAKFISRINLKLSIIFLIFLLLGLYLLFPNILEQINSLSQGKFTFDRWFTPGPIWLKSIDEFFSFPNGRYSYPLLTILPLTLGFFNYMAFFIALIWRKPSERSLIVYLPFLIIFFLYTCHLTLLRMPNFFTLATPIIILYSLYFWEGIYLFFKNRNKKFLNLLIIGPLILYSFIDYKSYSDYVFSYVEIFGKTSYQVEESFNLTDPQNDILPIFTNGGRFAKFHRTWPKVIKEKNPKYIFIFSAFIDNYCKYRFDKDYKESCSYFKNLLQEKEGYGIIWKMPLKFPFRPWNFDPELISNFYYLKRF